MRVGEAFKFARAVRAVRRSDLPTDHTQLTRDYLRIQARARRGSGPAVEHLAGFRVRVPSYPTFAFSVEEIFINEQYPWRPQTPRPLVIDAGANIGIGVLYWKTVAADARVIALEPDPDSYAALQENVARNALADVSCIEAAAAATDGDVTLFRDPATRASVLTTTTPGLFDDAGTTVRAVRLSPFVEDPTDLVKLDIEGAESAVLHELADSGALAVVRNLALEFTLHRTDGEHLSDVLHVLETAGFSYHLDALMPPRASARTQQNLLIWAQRA